MARSFERTFSWRSAKSGGSDAPQQKHLARAFERSFSWSFGTGPTDFALLQERVNSRTFFDLCRGDDDDCDTDNVSRETMSSMCSEAFSEDGRSWGDIAADGVEDFFTGLEENDGLGPLVHEEVKEAMLVPLPAKTVKSMWSPADETIMEGMLFKKGRAQMHVLQPRTWKYRYFKLQSSGKLSYYKNHHKKGSVSLAGKNVRLCAGTSFRTCIEPKTGNSNSTEWRFSIRTDQQEIVLAARTKNEMRKWLTVIRALCEARNVSVELVMNLEVEVDPKSMAVYVSEQEKEVAKKEEGGERNSPGRRRAQSKMPAPRPKGIETNSHHYDTFSPREREEGNSQHDFESDMGDSFGSPRSRAKTDVQREVFSKTKDWNERDGVLRVVRINDVPPHVYQCYRIDTKPCESL